MTLAGRAAVRPPRAVTVPRRRVADALAGLGLLVLVAGTFLPWLRSGTSMRNSYSADGAVRRLVAPGGVTAGVLALWPLLCLLATVALALLLTGFSRTGAVLASACSLAAAIVGVRVLLTGSNSVLGVAPLGPSVTLAGSVVVLAAVAATGASPSRRSRRIR